MSQVTVAGYIPTLQNKINPNFVDFKFEKAHDSEGNFICVNTTQSPYAEININGKIITSRSI